MATLNKKLCIVLALLAGCDANNDAETMSVPATTQSAATATAWFDLQLQLVQQTAGFTPPVASRAFAYSGVALYESVVHGMPENQSLAGQLHELASVPQPDGNAVYYWPAVANAALASIARQLFAPATAENVAAIDELEGNLAASYTDEAGPLVLERSAAYGRAVAIAIFEWSRSDGGDEGYLHNFPTSYVPPSGPGLWVPTPPAFQPAMQPYWGSNRMFWLTPSDCADGAPPEYSEEPCAEFFCEGKEVYETSLSLTPEQEQIARFWADDPMMTATPPGHSISIVTQVLEQNDATLDVAAEAYAKVSIAVADAFISCWAMKYQFNVLRPVTYIRAIIDPAWTPLINAPPFPEYPSGHSAQSGAAAQVLTDMFGTMGFTDHTHDARGLPARSFDSFFAAADEAAISRLYAGIHYRSAIEDGLDMGRCVGVTVSALPVRR